MKTVTTSAINNTPNDEIVNIMLRSVKQLEEARANGFGIFYRDYKGHLIPYIRVQWSDLMKIK